MWSPAGCVSVVVPTEGENIPVFGSLFAFCLFFHSNLNGVSVYKNLTGFVAPSLSLVPFEQGVSAW